MVQWQRLCAHSARGLGSSPGQGTRFQMPQGQRSLVLQLRAQPKKQRLKKSSGAPCNYTYFVTSTGKKSMCTPEFLW